LISLLLFVPAFAGEFHVKVIDPRSAAVAGAQVSVYRAGGSTPLQMRLTSGDGIATLNVESSGPLQVEVLAPGFAAARTDLTTSSSSVTVALKVAVANQTVIVTATRSLVSEDESATSVSVLTSEELETARPVEFGDALRFLPGAVVNVAGQRGGLG